EMGAIVGDHPVAALHGTDRRLDHGAAGVAKALAGEEIRLLPDHALAAYFPHLAVRVGNDPVPGEQPGRYLALVADGDGVGERVVTLVGSGLVADVVGADVDTDLVDGVCHGSCVNAGGL